jgi:hypothetical protein
MTPVLPVPVPVQLVTPVLQLMTSAAKKDPPDPVVRSAKVNPVPVTVNEMLLPSGLLPPGPQVVQVTAKLKVPAPSIMIEVGVVAFGAYVLPPSVMAENVTLLIPVRLKAKVAPIPAPLPPRNSRESPRLAVKDSVLPVCVTVTVPLGLQPPEQSSDVQLKSDRQQRTPKLPRRSLRQQGTNYATRVIISCAASLNSNNLVKLN